MGFTTSVAERVARFRSLIEDHGLDPEEALERIRQESRPPALQSILARAALLSSFDADAYRALLAREGAPAFDAFIARPEVEPVSGRSGSFTVEPDVRAGLVASWGNDPEGALELRRAAAAYYASPGREDPVARLYHLLSSDPKEALDLFETEFDKADRRFDLARCNALLDVVRGTGHRFGGDLAEAFARRERRYQARSLFARAYYRTGQYLHRPELHAAFDRVRGDSDGWILNLHATGGMGKTIFLRWLVARDLVPSGVPCARIDFDELPMDAVQSHPWMVLLPMCEQLNPQLPRPFLTEVLESAPSFHSLLQVTDGVGGKSGPSSPNELAARHDSDSGQGLVKRIGYALRESAAERIVVVLDTLERVTTLYPETFVLVFHLMERLHDLVPGLRLVLAGRDDVATKVPEVALALGAGATEYFLNRFRDDEAMEYLKLRGIPSYERVDAIELVDSIIAKVREQSTTFDEAIGPLKLGGNTSPELIDAIELVGAVVAKVREQSATSRVAGCNPFKLALLADLVLAKEGVDADYVRSLPGVDYAYLIERVIKRIDAQPLRWVVRYGVVPRRLTFDYMERVLLPSLRLALSGAQSQDKPQDLERVPEELRGKVEVDLWLPEPSADLSPQRLWDDLRRYESGKGWVSLVSGPDLGTQGGSLQFHSDVTGPMRDLLSFQPIFDPLQEESIRYFEALAEKMHRECEAASPQDSAGSGQRLERALRWADPACEVIFHRIYRIGCAPREGVEAWKRMLSDDLASANPGVRKKLALELLRPEYSEDGLIPRERWGRRLVEAQDLAEAHLLTAECLEALLRLLRATPDASWGEVRRHLRMLREIGGPTVSGEYDERLKFLEAALAAGDRPPDKAISGLRAVLANDTDPTRRLAAAWHLVEAAVKTSDQEAENAALAAIRSAEKEGPSPDLRVLKRQLVQFYLDAERVADARGWLLESLEAGIGTRDPVPVSDLLLLAEIELSLGGYDSALAVLSYLEPVFEGQRLAATTPDNRPWALCLSASLWSSVAAVPEELVGQIAQAAESLTDTPVMLRARLLHGLALLEAVALQLDDASAHWDAAVQLLEREGGSPLQAEIALHRTRTANRVGRYREALVLVENALSATATNKCSDELELERAQALFRSNKDAEARKALNRVLEPADSSRSPSARVQGQAIALGLALGLLGTDRTDRRNKLGDLQSLLEKAFPAERHLILEPLRLSPAGIDGAADWLQGIDKLLSEREDDRVERLLSVLLDVPRQSQESPDIGAVRRDLARVELHRICGDPQRALNLLDGIETGGLDDIADWKVFAVPQHLLIEEARRRIGRAGVGLPVREVPVSEPVASLALAAPLVERVQSAIEPAIELLLEGGRWVSVARSVLRALPGLASDAGLGEILAAADQGISRLLDQAAKALDSEPTTTRWSALDAELGGWLAMGSGHVDDAQAWLARAVALKEDLGDARGLVRLMQRIRAAVDLGLLPKVMEGDEKGIWQLVVEWDLKGLRQRLFGSETHLVLEPRWPDPPGEWKRFQASDGHLIANTLAEESEKDWRGLAKALGGLLLSSKSDRAIRGADPPLALRLKTPPGVLEALPWELVLLPGEESSGPGRARGVRCLSRVMNSEPTADPDSVRFVQLGLSRADGALLTVDGILGPRTRAAVSNYREKRGLESTGVVDGALIRTLGQELKGETEARRVMIVQAGQYGACDEESTSYRTRSSTLDGCYRDRGCDVRSLDSLDPKRLDTEIRRFRPSVVHLVAAFRETGGTVFLDLSRRRASSEDGALSAKHLYVLIKNATRERPRPFLVLDAVRPPSTFEAARALGLRNAFAADLQRLGGFSGVLASGLEQPRMLGTLAGAVAGAVAEGGTMGELGLKVRALFSDGAPASGTPAELDLALAYLGSALFAENPDLPVSLLEKPSHGEPF